MPIAYLLDPNETMSRTQVFNALFLNFVLNRFRNVWMGLNSDDRLPLGLFTIVGIPGGVGSHLWRTCMHEISIMHVQQWWWRKLKPSNQKSMS